MEVHISQLPLKRNYVTLNEEFNNALFKRLLIFSESIANASRLTQISKSVLGRFFRKEVRRIRIDFLLRITSLLNIPLEKVETNILWIGNNNSQGITRPKLPFTFNFKASARFLAAICNDGCITVGFRKGKKFSYGRLIYNNNEQSLRESVIKDAESIFGSNLSKEIKNRGDFFLAFPSIMRDVVEVITQFKGEKSANNPAIPSFILENKELMIGWLEQTIADEGQVKYEPENYQREIIWRRSFNEGLINYKLNEDEKRMLDVLGISYDVKNIGTYKTKKGIKKIRLQIRISKKENLIKLNKLIKIPDTKKQKVFEAMINSI